MNKSELEKIYLDTIKNTSGDTDFAATEITRQAAEIIPVRLKATPFSLAEIPLSKRKSFRVSRLLFSLFDGSRNLLESIRLTDRLTGTRSGDDTIKTVLETLEYLAEYGYVKLTVRHAE